MNVLLRLLLSIVFYIVFTPIGLLLRLLNVDLTRKSINPQADTYWEKNNHHVHIKPGVKK